MRDESLAVPKRVLENSYDIYADLDRINASLSRVTSALGGQPEQIPTIMESKPEIIKSETAGETKEAPSVREAGHKRTSETHSRAASLAKAFGLSSKILSSMSKEHGAPTHAEKHEREKPPGIHLTAQSPLQKGTTIPVVHSASKQQPTEIFTPPKLEGGTNIPVSSNIARSVPVKTGGAQKGPLMTPPTTSPLQVQKLPTMEKTQPVISGQKQIKTVETQKPTGSMETYSFSGPQKLEFRGQTEEKEEGKEKMAANNPVSNLLNLVKTKHSITIGEAADTLHIDRALVEKWAKLLNSNALLKIRYQLMGDTILEG